MSKDPRFLPTVYDLTAKTAELLGCHVRPATAITNAVVMIIEAVVGPSVQPSNAGLIDVRFEADVEMLHVEVATEPPAGRRPGWSVEAALVERRQLDSLRALIPDIEFVTREHRHLCRLTCTLSPRP